MKIVRALGVDLSPSCTGLVVLAESGTQQPGMVLEKEIALPKDDVGLLRQRAICERVLTVIHELQPDRIVVEGYSLNLKHASSVIPLVELGGMLRFLMQLDGLSWLEPRAGEVKKFATGKGNSPKSHVMMHVLKRWGHQPKSDDTADAYALACIGLAHAGKLRGCTKDMLGVVGSLKLRNN